MHNKSNGRRIRPQLELGQIIQNLGSPTYWDTGGRVPIIPFFGRVDPCKVGDGFKHECVPLCLMHRGRNSTATQCRTRVCMFTDCLYFLACFFQPFFRSNWVCLKMGYTSNYSHLVGIMISKTIGCFWVHYFLGTMGTQHFQTNPIGFFLPTDLPCPVNFLGMAWNYQPLPGRIVRLAFHKIRQTLLSLRRLFFSQWSSAKIEGWFANQNMGVSENVGYIPNEIAI